MRLSFIALAIVSCISLTSRGMADITVGGTYDENTVQTNTVNTSATSLTVQQMATEFADAFASGTGGVIDFDSGAFERDGSMQVQFGTRTVSLSNPFNDWGFGNLGTASTAGPISGARVLFDGAGSGTPFMNSIEIGEITEGRNVLDEGVTTFGMTIIDLRVQSNTIAFTITQSDNSTQTLNHTIPAGLNTNDTFFGFQADPGTHITRIDYTATRNLASDDWAFITSPIASVPEPSFGLAWFAFLAPVFLRRVRGA